MRARLDPDPERFWKLYDELQAALTIRIATVTADDRVAQVELDRLRAEWLALPSRRQIANSAAQLTRVYGDLLVEPGAGGGSPGSVAAEQRKSDLLVAAEDQLRGRTKQMQEAQLPAQATIAGLHPSVDGTLRAPGAEALADHQIRTLLTAVGLA